MDLFNKRGLTFAFNTMVAALGAIALSCWWDLPNPGWAALSVFIASSQMGGAPGAVTGRAWYRFLGTVGGTSASLLVLPAVADTPQLLVGVLALWVTVCVYLALIDRSPGNYAFLLAGYTVGVVGLPVVSNGGVLWDAVLGRVEEIGLGVACASIAHSVLFPRNTATIAQQKLEEIVTQARAAILSTLAAGTPASGHAGRARIAQGLAGLGEISAVLRFDLVNGDRPRQALRAIEEQLTALTFLLGAVEERMAALRRGQLEWPPLAGYLSRMSQWIRAGNGGDAPAPDAIPHPGELPPVHEALVVSVFGRIADIAQAWQALLMIVPALKGSPLPAHFQAPALRRSLHVDHGKAWLGGASVGITAALAATAAIMLGWQQPVLVSIAMALPSNVAFLDDPRPALRGVLVMVIAAVPIAALYLFAIFPAVDHLFALLLALAPLCFLIGLFMASPRYGLAALPFGMVCLTLIGLQLSRTVDFVAFSSLALAVLLSSVIALASVPLYRVISAEESARRIRKIAQSELRGLVREEARAGDRSAWASRALDRIALQIPRAGGAVDHPRVRGAFADARIGMNLLELRDVPDAEPELPQAVAAVARHVGARDSHVPVREDSDVIRAVDRAIERIGAGVPGESRIRALAAAAGLRTTLLEPA